MYPYSPTPPVTYMTSNHMGQPLHVIDQKALEAFKSSMEAYMTQMYSEIQTMKQHVNWVEPRLHDFHDFMGWMKAAHPDIIEAYTKSKQVAQALDKANNGMIYPQAAVSA